MSDNARVELWLVEVEGGDSEPFTHRKRERLSVSPRELAHLCRQAVEAGNYSVLPFLMASGLGDYDPDAEYCPACDSIIVSDDCGVLRSEDADG